MMLLMQQSFFLLVLCLATLCEAGSCSASKCASETGHWQAGISLLQASRVLSADVTASSPPSTLSAITGSSLADTLGLEVEAGDVAQNASTNASANSTSNSTSEAAMAVIDEKAQKARDLGTATALNYSEIIEPPTTTLPIAPYSANFTEDVTNIDPIANAVPLPPLDASNLTGVMLDCIMGDWGPWSDCQMNKESGMAGAFQLRTRGVIQPWQPGGQTCGAPSEIKTCNYQSVAADIMSVQR
eukprot:gb/GFBE01033302.1/.p1 GENE.gb/GFBE01033302.1/~~gb/GFBE01033302.1/.p1  ORF type:complete len:243 (+),score=50.16 gb/GFBE01033302.1/:1-729(+)